MSAKSKPGPDDQPLFDIEQTVHHVYHPEPGDEPTVTTEFVIPAALPPIPPTPNQPKVIYGEPGSYMDLRERAKLLKTLLPELGHYAMNATMATAAKNPAARRRMEATYGDQTDKRIKKATDQSNEFPRTLWNILDQTMLYEAGGKAVKATIGEAHRLTSEDRGRMLAKYGVNKDKERKAFDKTLDMYANWPHVPQKPKHGKRKP